MEAVYVPWLHMHQPLVWFKTNKKEELVSNLQKMILSKDQKESWDGKLIARAYKNPAKYIKILKKRGYEPRIILDYSGILLESLEELSKKKFFEKIEVEREKIGNLIKAFKDVLKKFPSCIEFAGTAYSHCYFPATPEEDWVLQVEEWKKVYKKIFGKKCLEKVKGFWLPELGVPGFEDKLEKLIKVLKEQDYEWLILPLQAVENYERLSFEERIKIACQPHLLRVKNQSITVVFRFPSFIIDQQAGCSAREVYEKAKETAKTFSKYSKRPALIIPASDGENGNVMMNEFFPQTFVPFFEEFKDEKVSSMLISEFLHTFYEKRGEVCPESEIKLKTLGASWINGHKLWLEGSKRLKMKKKIEKLSREFHEIEKKLKKKGLDERLEEVKKLLLIAETSCYVYWGVDFWFEQGEKTIKFVRKKLENLKKYL